MHVFIQSDRKYIKSHFAVQQTTSYTFLHGYSYNITSSGSEFVKLFVESEFAEETFSEILLDCTYSAVAY